VQVLGSEGGLEDEQIEVDLRRRGRQVRERVSRCVFLFRGELERRSGWCLGCGRRSTFDDLIETRLHRHGKGCVRLDYRGSMDEGERGVLHGYVRAGARLQSRVEKSRLECYCLTVL